MPNRFDHDRTGRSGAQSIVKVLFFSFLSRNPFRNPSLRPLPSDVSQPEQQQFRHNRTGGNLVNILAEVAQSGKAQNPPYKNSCLTHLMQESLWGNAKLTVICAISPDDRCRGETLSTLIFG
ncbi:hypothetical protein MRB53_027871 [Persea americana]|uniref:Uncharacterized protein n=1 Tax=Persea americana TaxID=3435 RepID=A0ACC2KEA4_PERAE|nr:hypothetical protein MRB53_027871 [Persea americana]